MTVEKKIGNATVRLVKGDLSNMDVDAFVFYAQHDLRLGSGYGTAISQRGGLQIQKELDEFGTVQTGTALTTSAGELKAKYIIHAVGPRFQEAETENKLRTTMSNVLKQAEDNGVERLALPPMGAGFYGVPLAVSAKVSLNVLKEHLRQPGKLKEVVICCTDARQTEPFQAHLETL